MRPHRARIAVLTVIAAAFFVAPSASHAGTLDYDGQRFAYTAAAGEVNGMNLGAAALGNVRDTAPIELTASADAVCDSTGDPGLVTCMIVAPFTVDLGDGDDAIRGAGEDDVIAGGAGNDQLEGGDGADVLDGGPGDDLLFGQADVSSLTADAADAIGGGPGIDTVIYRRTSQPLQVSLDGIANDGAAGEADNVAVDVENVTTGSGEDVLIGSDGPNVLNGDSADDLIEGRGGNDKLIGAGGNSRLFGNAGDDELIGGTGSDLLDGGSGVDRFVVDPPSCDPFGCGFGNDEVRARDDVRESIDCDLGVDTAVVDGLDLVQNCEQVDRPPLATRARCDVTVPERTSVARLLRRLTATASCSGAATVEARLFVDRRTARRHRLGRRSTRIAQGRAVVRSAGSARIALRVAPRARRRLRGARRLTATLRVIVSDQAGVIARHTHRIEAQR